MTAHNASEKRESKVSITIENGKPAKHTDNGTPTKSTAEATRGFVAAIAYGGCSIGMAFANKGLLNTYDFDYQFTVIFAQMLFTAVLLEILRHSHTINLPAYSLKRGYTFLLPSFFYAVHSVLALSALSGMNIPMYGVIKRCAPITTLLLGTLLLGKGLPSSRIVISVVCITIGCIIAGYGDLAFDLEAYVCGIASVVTQAAYLLLVQKGSQNNLSAVEILQLNAINTLPLLILCSVATGEFSEAVKHFQQASLGFCVIFFSVISMGCMLNYLLFLCTTLNSALTTTVVGTLKSILQTAIGMFTFGGISLNVFTITGLLINLFGGIMYSYTKYKDSQSKLKKVSSEAVIANGKA